ncbi:unnamed protein product [Mucor hiemalis]
MGNYQSGEIKYMYANIGGNNVSLPYVRLPNGQWVPLHQQNWYLQQWNAQRALPGNTYQNQTLLSPNLVNNPNNMYQCYVPNQVYYSGNFFR